MSPQEFYGEKLIYLEGAIIELTSRLDIIRKYKIANSDRDPIEHYTTRIKSVSSMKEKLSRRGFPQEVGYVFGNIYDAAGIRVICTYIDDVYTVANMLMSQSDITVIAVKDYIKNPKESGYRSYHIIVQLPLHVGEKTVDVYAEIQIRTMSMDFWASLDHKLKYKHDVQNAGLIAKELRRFADELASTEMNFQAIRDMIDGNNDL
jgi:putative GTP pyrophosphokinase